MKIIINLISKNLVINLVHRVDDLVTKNISVFCVQRVALYFKGIPNSIDFCKTIFLHVIPSRIVVS